MDLSPRLTALVDKALDYPIAEIVAPAGFGKSTIISWLADARGFSVARVRLESDPPLSLMSALCKAVSIVAPDLSPALSDAYANANVCNAISDLAPWFAESLPSDPAKIAIDDLHVLGDDESAWKLLGSVIDATTPARAQWILTSRVRPRTPEVEWVARGYRGRAITEKELAFDVDDILYASSSIGLTLAPEAARHIREFTGGWPLLSVYALRLLAQGDDLNSLIAVVRASGIEIVADRLLSQLTASEIELLIGVAVHDGATESEMQAMSPDLKNSIQRLVAAGVPLIRERDGRWRLHDLFRDHLRRTQTARCATVADQISRGLESMGLVDRALGIAVAGAAFGAVQRILETNQVHFMDAGERQLVHEAVTMVSTQNLKSSWKLAMIRGSAELRRGKPEIAESFFRCAIEASKGSDRTYALARLCNNLFWKGSAEESLTLLKECSAATLPEDADTACDVLCTLAWGYVFAGALDCAERAVETAISLLPGVTIPLIEARVQVRAGLVALYCSRLEEAEEFAQRAIEIAERHRLVDVLARAFALRKLIASPNRESDAIVYATKAVYYATKMLDRVACYYAEGSLLHFACQSGDVGEARKLLDRLLPVPKQLKWNLEAAIHMEASHVAMLDGDYDKADGFLARTTGFGDVKIEPGLLQVRQCIFGLYSALLLQLRGRCEDAVRVARRSAAAAPTRPRGIEITAIPEIEITKITCAAILGLNGKMSEAEAILADQARDAHEQYRRDLAAWVAAALVDPSAEPSQEAVTRANGIIILLRRAITAAQKQAVSLTPAESRVLRSLSEGRASKEVAAMTGRSVKTVDNQIAAILRKLGARSRGEAVARARRVGLLQGEPAESVRA